MTRRTRMSRSPSIMPLTTRSTPWRTPMAQTAKPRPTATLMPATWMAGSPSVPEKKAPTPSGDRPERAPEISNQQYESIQPVTVV